MTMNFLAPIKIVEGHRGPGMVTYSLDEVLHIVRNAALSE